MPKKTKTKKEMSPELRIAYRRLAAAAKKVQDLTAAERQRKRGEA